MARTSLDPVEIVCLCEGEWRICDGRIPAGDSRRLLSYVEQRPDGFEVLWLPTLSVSHVPSLEHAIRAARTFCSSHPVPCGAPA
jgi:hypothetical protein